MNKPCEPSEREISLMADFFFLMSDRSRLHILNLLERGSMCVGHIAEAIGMSQSAVSHQLALMKRMNLVKSCRKGKNIVYSLADEHIKIVFDIAYEHISEKITGGKF